MGGLALTPDPCPSFLLRLAGRRAGVGNGGRPLWLLQPDPRGGAGEGTGQRRRGRPTGWVSEGAAGNERGKSRCRRFPRAGRAGRPPSAGAAAAAASHAARLGARGSGIWVTGPSRTLGMLPWPPQKAPALPHVILPSEGFAKGWVFACTQEFPSQGRGSALGIFPAQTDPNPSQPNRSPSFNGVLLQRPRGMEGIHSVALRIIHLAGTREVPFRPRARLDRSARPHPPDSQLPWGDKPVYK